MTPFWKPFGASLIAVSLAAVAHGGQPTAADLIEMDFDELVNMDVKIESAGKTRTRAMDLPYAAHVITAQEIADSGAQTIPDILRLAPGVSVNQISSTEWAVGIRGQGGRFSRYVLVMVDGRIAYNEIFSGVNWDELNISIGDIDSIEVIAGPNAVAWGPNAVNGIIHIITRSAEAANGSRVSAWGGDDRAGLGFSQSADLAGDWDFRLSGHGTQWQGLLDESTGWREPDHEDWRLSFGLGQNSDSQRTQVSFAAFGAEQSPEWSWVDGQTLVEPIIGTDERKSGWATQFNHEHQLPAGWTWKLRGAADYSHRDTSIYDWRARNLQLDAELAGTWGMHRISGGINTRYTRSSISTDPYFSLNFEPENREVASHGLFLSDTLDLLRQLQLTVSARLDHHDLLDAQVQPSLRLLWSPTDSDRVWLAASSASTTPDRAIVDLRNVPYVVVPAEPGGLPLPLLVILGGVEGDKRTTRLEALELGYRKAWDRTSVELNLFEYHYLHTLNASLEGEPTLVFSADYQPTHLVQSGNFVHDGDHDSSGGEFIARSQITGNWSAQLSYSRVRRSDTDGDSSNINLQTNLTLSDSWRLNLTVRRSEGNATVTATYTELADNYGDVDDYTVADISLRWRRGRVSVDLSGRNLGPAHIEGLREEFTTPALSVEPTALVKVGYSF